MKDPVFPSGYDLYGGMPPHVQRETSERAAIDIEPSVESLLLQVKAFIVSRGDEGVTDDELEVYLGMRLNTARARRRELELKGLVKDSGRRRPTRSGKEAIVWVATSSLSSSATTAVRAPAPTQAELTEAVAALRQLYANGVKMPASLIKTCQWLASKIRKS